MARAPRDGRAPPAAGRASPPRTRGRAVRRREAGRAPAPCSAPPRQRPAGLGAGQAPGGRRIVRQAKLGRGEGGDDSGSIVRPEDRDRSFRLHFFGELSRGRFRVREIEGQRTFRPFLGEDVAAVGRGDYPETEAPGGGEEIVCSVATLGEDEDDRGHWRKITA